MKRNYKDVNPGHGVKGETFKEFKVNPRWSLFYLLTLYSLPCSVFAM